MEWSERPVRRVLVALDCGPDYYAHLQRGAVLARALGAELSVLFIEDDNLFRLCGLPIVEIAVASRACRPVQTLSLERELRARAAEARASLERIARVAELAWSFQVWRGHAAEALSEAARHADLVSLTRALRPLAPSRRATVHVRALAPAPAPVVAFYEARADADVAERVIEIALRLARSHAAPLLVLAAGTGGPAGRRARLAAARRLEGSGVVLHWRSVQPTRRALLRTLATHGARLLVLDAHGPIMSDGLLDEMLQETGAEALLVGGAGAPSETAAGTRTRT
jgi:hypothetical protein